MRFVAKSTVVPESSNATICVERIDITFSDYELTIKPTAVAGGATGETFFEF